jgi:hypothetical protein
MEPLAIQSAPPIEIPQHRRQLGLERFGPLAGCMVASIVPGRDDHRLVFERQGAAVEVAADFPSRETGDA